jgi:hypothetical protein
MPAERAEQRMSEAPAQVPAAQKAPDNAQAKKEARKGKETLTASAVEKSVKTFEHEMKAERPAYADKKADSVSGLAGGYAPAPQENYKAAAPASTPVYGREPELKGSMEYNERYKERAGAAKAMKSMPSRGYSADTNDRSIAKSQESPSLTARDIWVEGAPVSLHMIATDTKIAGDQIADVMRKFGAKDIKVESKEDKLIVRAMLQVQWLQPLYEKLKAIGSMQENTAPVFADVSSVKITIEIIKAK